MAPTVPNWHGLTSEDKESALVAGNTLVPRQVVGLINASAKVAQLVRVTLKPLQRADRAPTHPRMPGVNNVAVDGLRAGFALQPAAPGGIPNPIIEGSQRQGEGTYVHITWGVGGAKPHELVADWPVMGASIELTADQVTVEAVCGPQLVAPNTPGGRPRFAADLCPSWDLPRTQYDSLTFAQSLTSSIVTSPDSVEAAVPEFATAVELGFGDLLPAGSSVQVDWLNPGNGGLDSQRYDGATLPSPFILPVPEHAVAIIVSIINGGVIDTTLMATWRIAP